MLRAILLCSACLAVGALRPAPSTRPARHWDNWIYLKEAHHWHTLWCRWKPSGEEILPAMYMERMFEPTDNDDNGFSQKNIYHFEDERGTVSEGRMCGPWFMTEEEMSTDVGVVHPFAPTHTTLLLPGGPCAWTNKTVESGAPLCCELFLHGAPPSHLRMSASFTYSAEGELEAVVFFRDDDRGPWPSAGWSACPDARIVSPVELAAVLARYEDASGEGDALSATLEPESLQAVPFGACRVASASDEDVILLCADDTVAIIAPKRVPSAPFSICAVWADGAGAPPAGSADAGAGGACTIEALWYGGCESAHKLEAVRHLRFAAP